MTLKQAREGKGLSQADLADAVGLKPSPISQEGHGSRKPSLVKAKRLSNILGISLDEFFCLSTFQNEI